MEGTGVCLPGGPGHATGSRPRHEQGERRERQIRCGGQTNSYRRRAAEDQGVCAVNSPSSINGKKRTWWHWSRAVITAPLNSPTCSASPALPSIGQWNESEPATSWAWAQRPADGSVRCPAGTPPAGRPARIASRTFRHRSTFVQRTTNAGGGGDQPNYADLSDESTRAVDGAAPREDGG